MEAWERSIAMMVKGGYAVDKQEKIALENELRTDKGGVKLDFIHTGASGKQLNLDGFKFDDKFGKKYHQTDSNYQNDNGFGSNSFPSIGMIRPQTDQAMSPNMNHFGNSAFGSTPQPSQVQNGAKIGEKGFLDFDTMFTNPTGQKSNSNTGFNPFN